MGVHRVVTEGHRVFIGGFKELSTCNTRIIINCIVQQAPCILIFDKINLMYVIDLTVTYTATDVLK